MKAVVVDFVHAFGAIITFGNHFHFHLSGCDRITFANHRAKSAVAAEARVCCHKKVAQIYRIVDVTWQDSRCFEKEPHFTDSIRHKDCLEIVAIL